MPHRKQGQTATFSFIAAIISSSVLLIHVLFVSPVFARMWQDIGRLPLLHLLHMGPLARFLYGTLATVSLVVVLVSSRFVLHPRTRSRVNVTVLLVTSLLFFFSVIALFVPVPLQPEIIP